MNTETSVREDGRRQRADGERTRTAILTAAAELATVEGLDGLSIGRLADHVGMSKSGVFAHFRSKEELQYATVDTAREIYDREVTQLVLQAPEGAARVYAYCDAFLAHLERSVFPGGCFFISAASELEAKTGPVRDYVKKAFEELVQVFADSIERAQELGELDPEADSAQILFELDSLLLMANISLVFFGDETATDRARVAARACLDRWAPRS